MEEKISRFVRSDPKYKSGRKRPKDPDEARLLLRSN